MQRHFMSLEKYEVLGASSSERHGRITGRLSRQRTFQPFELKSALEVIKDHTITHQGREDKATFAPYERRRDFNADQKRKERSLITPAGVQLRLL